MYGMPTLANEVTTTNVIANYEARKGKGIKSIFEEIVSDYRAAWEGSLNPKVSVSTADLKAAISAAESAAADTGVVEGGGQLAMKSKSMAKRTLESVLSAGETAANVMRFRL